VMGISFSSSVSVFVLFSLFSQSGRPATGSCGKEGVLPNLPSFPADIQFSSPSMPSVPSWFGEVTVMARALARFGVLTAIQEQVRFAHARFGQYDLIDFVAMLIGHLLSGEPTLLAFYERLPPFAGPFMATFGRNRLPHRSTLSRFLAALDLASVEAFRLFSQKNLLMRKPFPSLGGLFDRTSGQ